MNRFWEIVLGLDKGFLRREGELHWHFNPRWPGQEWLDHAFHRAGWGATLWNLLLIGAAAVLVVMVYRREGRSRPVRVALGALRATLFAVLLVLLNRPVLTLVQSVSEPSVLAVVIDDTVSMQVRDAVTDGSGRRIGRLEAVVDLLSGQEQVLLRQLAARHVVKVYKFQSQQRSAGNLAPTAQAAEPIAVVQTTDPTVVRGGGPDKASGTSPAPGSDLAAAAKALADLKPEGGTTQVIGSLRSVLESLQGQRVAGVVLLTDGRDNPAEPVADGVRAIQKFGVKVYPIAVGSEQAPHNVAVRTVSVQDSAFVGDVVNVKAAVQATGYEAGHPVRLSLVDARTKAQLRDQDGKPVERTVTFDGDKPQEVELQFKAAEKGMLDVTVVADPQPGEINDKDNQRTASLEVLDAKINVLYVDGYPRWEYRYFKTEMIREPSVNVSCILTSADVGFAQEHTDPAGRGRDDLRKLKYFPFREFPSSEEAIQECDVILFGDVEPRHFTDSQLALVKRFVEEYGGGFGMIAGPRWSPAAYRNTAIQDLLPVTIARVEGSEQLASIAQGFRPAVTKEGEATSIFRFLPERERNERFLREGIQPLFWYCRGVSAKPGLGEVLAEHPGEMIDGRKAPLLVVGHYGAGRTLFSAYDDSWRWRFYTGESIFNTYWVQQLRYLARSKKLGSRGMTFASAREGYEVGEQVHLSLHVLNRKLLRELPEQLNVEITGADGQIIRREALVRQEGQVDTYVCQFTADRIGQFTAKLPPIASGTEAMNVRVDVAVPALELAQPQVDRSLLGNLAEKTNALLPDQKDARLIELAEARRDLPKIPSAAKQIPLISDTPLWAAPLALVVFVLLITLEWVLRKVYGML